ncbi:translation elongation factor EF-1alpha (GTPase) HBS1 isoform X2 [Andrena cerasifolii]|uniref:translation elongation factor EF-1alpha (GTPase) HBS1 isoform X2 n=1 Tax=Andrena cerasifolii TaxID=2819439 RepID=UPI0040378502
MSRHRSVRSMNYSEEYEGYDDVYGHSVEDDYCVSPSAEQFLFDRSKQQNMASFITEPDIVEDNEDGEESVIPSNEKDVVLTELERAKLVSCMDSIKNIIGDTVPDSEIQKKILQSNFNADVALDLVLKESPPKNVVGKQLSSKPTFQVTTPSNVKIIPAGKRSVVKGFDLGGAESTEQLNSRIESPRSQSPFPDYNSPEVKRKEHIVPKEKKVTSSRTNSPRCQSPVSGHVTSDLDSKIKLNEEKVDALKIYKSKRGDCKEQLHLVVVGHVDAGKSTLLGRLLCDLGQVSSKLIHKYQQESKKIGKQSFVYAWVLDETGEERERGITMDIGHSKFETETKSITLLDAPGHRDFIPNMITGATQADVALLVVDATRGEFETGFDSGGQTREHALLLRSLGVSQLAVVVNKLDTVDWSKDRFNEIVDKMSVFLKQAGFRDKVTFVPCSGLSGENIVTKPKEPLSNWYKGPMLVNVIDNFKCPERPISKPFRFSVNDIFKGTGSGFCVSGHVETGMISLGDKVLVLPRNEVAVVKGLQIDEVSVTNAFAGDRVALTLSGIDQQNVGIGDIICNLQNPVPVTTCFQAHVVIFAVKIPIMKGLPVVMHQQSLVQPAVITKLVAQLHRTTGEVVKKRPRCLPKNASAIIEITTQSPVCMELYKDIKQLGRVMLRVDGTTVAAGLITKIK